MAFCFNEGGIYTKNKIQVMEAICREIWPNEAKNPFAHGAVGPYIIYYSGTD